jgi:hypothetical protein
MKKVLVFISLLLVIGCATKSDLSKIKPGATQEAVFNLCEEPISKDINGTATGWLYSSMESTKNTLWPERRYYWVIFNKENKVVGIVDAGMAEGRISSNGKGYLCKDAIVRGDKDDILVYCK